jgi:hypothetical protein
MIKYRIIERSGRYFPQWRMFWVFWTNYHKRGFYSFHEAESWLIDAERPVQIVKPKSVVVKTYKKFV